MFEGPALGTGADAKVGDISGTVAGNGNDGSTGRGVRPDE